MGVTFYGGKTLQNMDKKQSTSIIRTNSNILFDPLNPDPNLIDIGDIIHSLSGIPRYNAHSNVIYTVGEHTLNLLHVLQGHNLEVRQWAFMHDAGEAYLGDMVGPIKPFMKGFTFYEKQLDDVLFAKFGLEGEMPELVKKLDKSLVVIEMARLFNGKVNNKITLPYFSLPRLDVKSLLRERYDELFD